jgi:hypothetical protein
VALECQTIQEMVTESGGDIDRFDAAVRQHFDTCAGCREVAAGERAIGLLFSAAVPPADREVERRVMASLKPARIRRRIVAFMPVAASLIMVLAGALMLGGVPGSGVLSFVPKWSADGWMAFVTRASDWGIAMATGARAAAAVLDPMVLVTAGVISLLGVIGVAVTAVRWRKASPWRRPR